MVFFLFFLWALVEQNNIVINILIYNISNVYIIYLYKIYFKYFYYSYACIQNDLKNL